MKLLTQWTLLFALLAGVFLLSACGSSDAHPSNYAMLPDWVSNSSPRVREAYDYAISHGDELKNYPCYCGCGAMGHDSNLSCYIRDVAEDGTITFDNHATGCGICVDITQDVMRMKADGRSSTDVRAYIDAQYSPFGPGTDTPLPRG